MKITIVDDTKEDLEDIKKILTSLITEELSIYPYYRWDEAINKFKSDLYILDIDIPTYNGFSISKKIATYNKNAIFIFCTKHEDLVFQSYETEALFFVRKNFLKEDLQKAIQKYYKFNNHKEIIIKKNSEVFSINIQDVEYIEANHSYIDYHLIDSSIISDRNSLQSILNLNIPSIQKISSGVLVNFENVNKIHRNEILMKSGITLYSSRSNAKEVKESYYRYILEKR